MNMRRLILLVVTTLLASLAFSQEVVHWKAHIEPSGTLAPNQRATVVLEATIDKGWHLYSQKVIEDGPQPTTISVADGKIKGAGQAEQQPPLKTLDPNFGKEVEYYKDSAWFKQPIQVAKDAKGSVAAKVEVRYGVCNDQTCLPPTTVTLTAQATVDGAPVADTAPPTPAKPVSNAQEANVETAKSNGIFAFLLLSISFGFLSLLTPCVFPMIPITVSFFAKRRETEGSGSALTQAAAYCFGIILTFTLLGLIVTLAFGASGLQGLATNPILNLGLGTLFAVLALNLFGAFEIALPGGLANKVSPHGKGKYVAPLLMAFAFSITSFTCTMPFVGSLLVAASQGDFFYPIVGMIGFSTAFALPFFLLALFPTALSKLPKSGAWMVVVKAFMGFLELAAAVKFFSNTDLVWQAGWLTRPVFLAIWAGIMVVAGLFMLGAIRLPKVDEGGIGPIRRVIGLASLALGVWFLSAINGRPIGELDAYLPPTEYGSKKADDGKWIDNLDKGLALAKEQGKPIFVDFTGVTCTNCRWMEKNMFPRADVVKRFDKFVLVRLFTDRAQDSDRKNQEFQKKVTKTVALPVYMTMDATGKPIKILEGATRDPETFTQFLDSSLPG